MNILKQTTLAAIAATTLASGAHAAETTGLVGQRYGEINVGALRVDSPLLNDDAGSVEARVNLPVHENLDLVFLGSYSELDDLGANTELLGAGLRIYSRSEAITPFVELGFGYADAGTDWDEVWTLGAGFEWIIGENVVTTRLGFEDGDGAAETYVGAVELFRWVSDTVGVGGTLSYADSQGSTEAYGAELAVRLKF